MIKKLIQLSKKHEIKRNEFIEFWTDEEKKEHLKKLKKYLISVGLLNSPVAK
ncbi:hypothetical protein JE945_002479 [Flavobacterium psychrophilum]|nr:hypothetical protein [Flavobacterium psychrophilum]